MTVAGFPSSCFYVRFGVSHQKRVMGAARFWRENLICKKKTQSFTLAGGF